MTHPPEPAFGAGTRRPDEPAWWWLLLDADGRPVTTGEPRPEFPTRGDAESWLGEAYPDLAEDGVSAVTLHEGDREVYGPMSLEAG